MDNNMGKVAVVMGSDSDWSVMVEASKILSFFGVKHQSLIVSAHRTPKLMYDFAQNAYSNGIRIIIAGAGGAAHLPGMMASLSVCPVIGVPIKSSNSIDGWDSILSILQMPNGIPVATVALNAAKNAGILAVEILAVSDVELHQKLLDYKGEMEHSVLAKKLQNIME